MKKLLITNTVLMLVLLLASCAKDLTPQESIAKAREYIAAGDYASANILLKNTAQNDPKNAEARFELAAIALALGDGLSAEKEARRAIDLGMPPEQVTLLLIKALYLQGEFDKLLAESEKLPVKLDPLVTADILAYRAHAQIQKQQYRLADATIEEALKQNENSVIAILAKASYEAQVGRRETAMELAARAVEIDPASSDAWAMMGDLQSANGDLAAARESYDKAIANRRYVSLAQARRGFIAAQLEDYPAARSDVQQLYAAGYKDQPYVNFVKGYIAFRQAQYPEATEALESSVERDPNNPLSKLYLAASYMKEGKLEQARRIANQLYYEIPNSVDVARLVASINVERQDFGAARAALAALLEVQKDDAVALGMLGSMALMEGRGDEAVDYFQRLSSQSPDDLTIQRMLRLAMTMRGDFVGEMGAAAEQTVAPEDFNEVLLAAGVALKEGQLKEAVAISENLQQQYPDRVEPLTMLAAIYLSVGDWRRGKLLLEQALAKSRWNPPR
ncbi:MAG: tetratricopeptide repeat protein [Halioglobus sp.]